MDMAGKSSLYQETSNDGKIDFQINDLVWAKMKGYPPWPAVIAEPDPKVKCPNSRKPHHFVYFFGTRNVAWILDDCIFPHTNQMLEASKHYNKYPKHLKAAIQEITEAAVVEECEDITPYMSDLDLSQDSLEQTESSIKSAKIPKYDGEEKLVSEIEVKDHPIPKIDIFSLPGAIRQKNLTIQSLKLPIKISNSLENVPAFIERPETPPVDLNIISNALIEKNLEMITVKKIGLIGLGHIGQGIAKNLLHSKHHVVVWNRSEEKCDPFVKAGAYKGESPADVVMKSDIIVCCVSDPTAAKSIVFGNTGVLKGLESSDTRKSYVEMSSIDPRTSQEVSEALQKKGAQYLEAPLCGSRDLANEGLLLVMAAGDRYLFEECIPIFRPFAKNVYFVSHQVGSACKMKLILNTFMGSAIAALAETLTFAEGLYLSPKHFLEVLRLSSSNLPALKEKGENMTDGNFPNNTALKYQEKNLILGLKVGDLCDQPMIMTSTSKEIYKRAKARGYAEHDSSAVIFATK